MPADKTSKGDGAAASAKATVGFPTGIAKLISAEAESAIADRSSEAAAALHALDQRLQEILVALPAAVASVDETSEIGVALKALGTFLA